MKRPATAVLTLVIVAAAAVGAMAGDPAAGKAKANVCAACHGPAGLSPNGQWPNLAAQKAEYIILQLKAFKEGARKNALMSPQAAGLTDKDIEDLAAYYASMNCNK